MRRRVGGADEVVLDPTPHRLIYPSWPRPKWKAAERRACGADGSRASGASFTLWSGEEIVINTNVGLFPVQIGFALYESGEIKSLEPAYPIPIVTPLGNVTVYDEHAIGIESDDNSLKFDQLGNIIGFTSSYCSIAVFCEDGSKKVIAPSFAPSMTDDDAMEKIPLTVRIIGDKVVIDNGETAEEFSYAADQFVIRKEYETDFKPHSGCTGGDCSSCSSCHS